MTQTSNLALLGGPRALTLDSGDLFSWPILTGEDDRAVVEELQTIGSFEEDSFLAFEQEFAAWCGAPYAVSHDSGSAAMLAALFACGVGHGDEVIAPSATSWGAVLPCFRLGATPVFAEIDPLTLNLDPRDIEGRISERTRAIVAVHQFGYPADMDAINAVARRHGLRVIEDASHAHGSRYRGRLAGTLGDIAVFSMSAKPLALGEGGMLVTGDRDLYERALAWGQNFRFSPSTVQNPELLPFIRLPMGSVTARMHNLSAVLGRVQLRHYDRRMAEIDQAMQYFWDLLEGVPGLAAHRPPRDSGTTMGGWYSPRAIYRPEQLGGLSAGRFAQALRAEGCPVSPDDSLREPLHLHPLLNTCDIYRQGAPTRIANAARDLRQPAGSLPVTEQVYTVGVPAFRRFRPELIEQHADCYRKVARHAAELLPGDPGDAPPWAGR